MTSTRMLRIAKTSRHGPWHGPWHGHWKGAEDTAMTEMYWFGWSVCKPMPMPTAILKGSREIRM